MKKLSKRNVFRIVWAITGITLMLWNWSTFQARDIPASIFQESELSNVIEDDHRISFHSNSPSHVEFIFLPGGFVDPIAYAPMARALSDRGLTVHIIKMPWRLSKLGYNKISDLFDFEDSGSTFILGGHSQGGKMAAQYVHENPSKVDGLILLGTSHPRDFDISYSQVPTMKLYAEHDGLSSVREVMGNSTKLPKKTELVLIEGGNHSQFGNLGNLLGDDAATISREDQQELVIHHIMEFAESFRIAIF